MSCLLSLVSMPAVILHTGSDGPKTAYLIPLAGCLEMGRAVRPLGSTNSSANGLSRMRSGCCPKRTRAVSVQLEDDPGINGYFVTVSVIGAD